MLRLSSPNSCPKKLYSGRDELLLVRGGCAIFTLLAKRLSSVATSDKKQPTFMSLESADSDGASISAENGWPRPLVNDNRAADAGIYELQFDVDGLIISDPGSSLPKPERQVSVSYLEIPSDEPSFCDVRDVPHGTMRLEFYPSKVLGVTRPLLVYTPPGYDQEQQRSYPVLYLYHGYGDTVYSWAPMAAFIRSWTTPSLSAQPCRWWS